MVERVHRAMAAVLGEMSLALVRGHASRRTMLRWAQVLRRAAGDLESLSRTGTGNTRRDDAPPSP